ncbi:hypothetical protein ACWGI8_44450, partial [Streptomyces sp. NPDC054841]
MPRAEGDPLQLYVGTHRGRFAVGAVVVAPSGTEKTTVVIEPEHLAIEVSEPTWDGRPLQILPSLATDTEIAEFHEHGPGQVQAFANELNHAIVFYPGDGTYWTYDEDMKAVLLLDDRDRERAAIWASVQGPAFTAALRGQDNPKQALPNSDGVGRLVSPGPVLFANEAGFVTGDALAGPLPRALAKHAAALARQQLFVLAADFDPTDPVRPWSMLHHDRTRKRLTTAGLLERLDRQHLRSTVTVLLVPNLLSPARAKAVVPDDVRLLEEGLHRRVLRLTQGWKIEVDGTGSVVTVKTPGPHPDIPSERTALKWVDGTRVGPTPTGRDGRPPLVLIDDKLELQGSKRLVSEPCIVAPADSRHMPALRKLAETSVREGRVEVFVQLDVG